MSEHSEHLTQDETVIAGESTALLFNKTSSDSSRESQHAAAHRNVRCTTIELVCVIYTLYRATVTPTLQQYIYSRVEAEDRVTQYNVHHLNGSGEYASCQNSSDGHEILEQDVQAEASLWMIYQNLCGVGLGFFSTIFLGGYSDRAGRRIAILTPIVGGLMRALLSLLVMLFGWPLYVLLLAAALEGICGGLAVFYMGAFSYISDITSHEQRSMRIMIAELCLMLGGSIGSLASGFMIQYIDFSGASTTMCILLLLDVVLVVTTIQETILRRADVTFWTLEHFKESFRVYTKRGHNNRRLRLLTAALALLIICPVMLGRDDVVMLLTFKYPICWQTIQFGVYRAIRYAITFVGSFAMTKFLQPRLGDLALCIIGCASVAVEALITAFTHSTLMMYMGALSSMFSGLIIGMIRSANSKLVTSHEMGAMFSWVAWIEVLGMLLGSVIFNSIYRATLEWFSGFVFIVISVNAVTTALIISALLVMGTSTSRVGLWY